MLSGGNSCAEHEGQGRGSAQGQVSGTPESGDSKLLESLIHPKEAALGKDMEEAQGITVGKVQVHWGRRAGLVLSQHLCGPGEQGSTGMCGNRETLGQESSGIRGDRGALGQGSSAALLLIQTQAQNKTLGKTSKGK